MKRLFIALFSVSLLAFAGCSKKSKEVPASVKAESDMFVSEAQFAMGIREFSRAEELVQKAIKLRDDVPEFWVSLGMARVRQDNKKGARTAYEKALKLHTARYKDEKKPEELAQQAFVLGLLGRNDEAIKLLNQGLKDHADSSVLKKMASPQGLPRTFQSPQFKELAL